MGQACSCPNLKRELVLDPTKVDRSVVPLTHKIVTSSPSSLLGLPGELRNRIFELCVSAATTCPTCHKVYDVRIYIHHNRIEIRGIDIGMPVLFASKLAYQELGSLFYSRVSVVAIKVDDLQYSLPCHPFVQKFAKTLVLDLTDVALISCDAESKLSILIATLASFMSLLQLEILCRPVKGDFIRQIQWFSPLLDCCHSGTAIILAAYNLDESCTIDPEEIDAIQKEYAPKLQDCLVGVGKGHISVLPSPLYKNCPAWKLLSKDGKQIEESLSTLMI